MCAEAYTLGDPGDNACPENALWIGSAAACKRAANVIDEKVYGVPDNDPARPSGCSLDTIDGFVHFNVHPVGSGDLNSLPLCAAGTAQSRSTPQRSMPRTTRTHRRAPTAENTRRPPLQNTIMHRSPDRMLQRACNINRCSMRQACHMHRCNVQQSSRCNM
jgi:hypothetical protein